MPPQATLHDKSLAGRAATRVRGSIDNCAANSVFARIAKARTETVAPVTPAVAKKGDVHPTHRGLEGHHAACPGVDLTEPADPEKPGLDPVGQEVRTAGAGERSMLTLLLDTHTAILARLGNEPDPREAEEAINAVMSQRHVLICLSLHGKSAFSLSLKRVDLFATLQRWFARLAVHTERLEDPPNSHLTS